MSGLGGPVRIIHVPESLPDDMAEAGKQFWVEMTTPRGDDASAILWDGLPRDADEANERFAHRLGEGGESGKLSHRVLVSQISLGSHPRGQGAAKRRLNARNVLRSTLRTVRAVRGLAKFAVGTAGADPTPEFLQGYALTREAAKGHEPAWQLRMLTSCESGEAGSADSDASLSELANALRSGVSQHLADPDWVLKFGGEPISANR